MPVNVKEEVISDSFRVGCNCAVTSNRTKGEKVYRFIVPNIFLQLRSKIVEALALPRKLFTILLIERHFKVA